MQVATVRLNQVTCFDLHRLWTVAVTRHSEQLALPLELLVLLPQPFGPAVSGGLLPSHKAPSDRDIRASYSSSPRSLKAWVISAGLRVAPQRLLRLAVVPTLDVYAAALRPTTLRTGL